MHIDSSLERTPSRMKISKDLKSFSNVVCYFPILLLMFAALLAASASAQTSFVRVHQTGYVSSAPKRAYLMSSTASAGASFSVLNSSGTPVYSAAIGASQGAWGTFKNVYALDFDSVTTTGTFTISVSGSITATSPTFQIGTGSALYASPLANTLFFYQNERDGANFLASPLRTAAAHLNDAHARFISVLPSTGKTAQAP
jgi:endoglucanase